MKRQRFITWTGGQRRGSQESQRLAEALPYLPPPAPLFRAALIEYQWGAAKFEIVSTACSVRATPWGSEEMIWLHCKAMQTVMIQAEQPTGLMSVLIPAHYVTGIQPGPAYRIVNTRRGQDIGIFPPNQVTPASAVPLAQIERALAELRTPERN